jgi:hypothetical protein
MKLLRGRLSMKKGAAMVVILAVVGASVLSLGGCSLSTSTADITVKNTWSDSDVVVLDGSSRVVNGYGQSTWTVEWDGLSDETYKVEVWDDYEGGYFLGSDKVTVSDGDSVTLSY